MRTTDFNLRMAGYSQCGPTCALMACEDEGCRSRNIEVFRARIEYVHHVYGKADESATVCHENDTVLWDRIAELGSGEIYPYTPWWKRLLVNPVLWAIVAAALMAAEIWIILELI